MFAKLLVSEEAKLIVFLVVVCLAKGYEVKEVESSAALPSKAPPPAKKTEKLTSETLAKKDKSLSPVEAKDEDNQDDGFIEVKEEDIPEGSPVYVLEEPLDTHTDGETLKTANNIVFRPLFRYREKQEAQRRNSNSIRRRYFIPKRVYRGNYFFPYYYYYPIKYN